MNLIKRWSSGIWGIPESIVRSRLSTLKRIQEMKTASVQIMYHGVVLATIPNNFKAPKVNRLTHVI